MKYCPSCATSLDDNIRECPQCGHVFADVNTVSDTSQRPGNVNAESASNYAESKMNQPPAYSVSPVVNQTTTNNSTGNQPVPKWKQLLPLFIAIGVVVTIMQGCIFGLAGSGSQETNKEEITTTTTVKTYDVSFNIECEQNLIFSKYDVIVLIDGSKIGKIDHGTKTSITVALTEGTHTVKFQKDGSESVDGSREISVTGKSSVNCKIRCTSSQVEIEEFDTAVDATEPVASSTTKTSEGTTITDIVANYSFELQSYWKEDISNRSDSSHLFKTENDSGIVSLIYSVNDDTNNTTFKTIVANKAEVAKSIANSVNASNYTVLKQEVKAFGDATGLFSVLDTTINSSNAVINARFYVFDFPSVEEQKIIQIGLVVQDSVKYNYLSDFSKILNSLKKVDGSTVAQTDPPKESTTESSATTTVKATPTPVPSDITKKDDTRFAFKRTGAEYTIYYIIDLTEKKVYYFTSMDTKPTIGTFENGDLKKGITVKYPYDGGTDVISYYKGNSNRIVVYDQNGFDWYYDSCYISEAESVIAK